MAATLRIKELGGGQRWGVKRRTKHPGHIVAEKRAFGMFYEMHKTCYEEL